MTDPVAELRKKYILGFVELRYWSEYDESTWSLRWSRWFLDCNEESDERCVEGTSLEEVLAKAAKYESTIGEEERAKVEAEEGWDNDDEAP
jgi:hypothetical protein